MNVLAIYAQYFCGNRFSTYMLYNVVNYNRMFAFDRATVIGEKYEVQATVVNNRFIRV